MARLPAGVRRRKDGTLEKRFTVNNKRYSVYGRTNRELMDKELQKRQELSEGLLSSNPDTTLDKYFDVWLRRKALEDKEVTPYRYQKQYQANISPYLGFKKLHDLTRSDIFLLQQKLATRLHPTTVNYLIRLVRSVLDDAVMEEILPRNPAAGIRTLKNPATPVVKTTHRALTIPEQRLFMREARGNFYYEFFAMLLLTGLRYGEAAALTWADIDEENNLIHITKSLTFDKDGHVMTGPTKTRSGTRDIPLTSQIRQILSQQRQKLVDVVGLTEAEASNPKQQIFCSASGNVLHNRTANLNLRRILRSLDAKGEHIDHFTMHALRDTFATRFIEQGGNPQTLKALLGHSRLSVTMDLYSQVLPNTKQVEMDRLVIDL